MLRIVDRLDRPQANDALEIALEQRHGGALHGDIGACSRGDADCRLRECGRFVVLIFAGLTSLWGVIAAEVDVSLLVAGNGLRPPRRGPNGAASRRLAVLPNQT